MPVTFGNRGMGWIRDRPDPRDFKLHVPLHVMATLPPSADLQPQCTPVCDQDGAGACTGAMLKGCLEFLEKKQADLNAQPLSMLFSYWCARDLEHSTGWDAGASIRDVVKGAARWGYTEEAKWPFFTSSVTSRPGTAAYNDARKSRIQRYERVFQTADQLKAVLASGLPICFGFSCLTSMFTHVVEQSGIISMPQPGDRVEGGHAVLLVAYDDSIRLFKFKNSWSPGWGRQGYGSMHYDYLLNPDLASDFWVVRLVPPEPKP